MLFAGASDFAEESVDQREGAVNGRAADRGATCQTRHVRDHVQHQAGDEAMAGGTCQRPRQRPAWSVRRSLIYLFFDPMGRCDDNRTLSLTKR